MHEMNLSFVAVVSWYNFKFIWLHRSQVIKTTNWRKIKLTPIGKVEKQRTQAIGTLYNIPINNKLDLRYLVLVLHQILQKTNDTTSVQNIFNYL